jgi:hypothetical protein
VTVEAGALQFHSSHGQETIGAIDACAKLQGRCIGIVLVACLWCYCTDGKVLDELGGGMITLAYTN